MKAVLIEFISDIIIVSKFLLKLKLELKLQYSIFQDFYQSSIDLSNILSEKGPTKYKYSIF
jgi:hypothetical protein